MTTNTELNDLILLGKEKQQKILYPSKKFDGLAFNTLKNYSSNLIKLHREINTELDILNLVWLNDVDKIMTFINDLKTNNTKKSYLSVVLTVMNSQPDKYKISIDKYASYASNINLKIKIDLKTTKSDSDNIMDMSELDAFILKLKKKRIYETEVLQFSILREYPIRNELATLIYIKNADYNKLSVADKKSKNWIIEYSNKITMVRNNYKTAKLHGQITTIINASIKQLIKAYVKLNEIASNTPIFTNKNGSQQTEGQLSLRLSYVSGSLIDKSITTGSIFKIVCKDIVDNFDGDKVKQITEMGQIRGTGIKTIVDYYIYGISDNMSDTSE